MAISWRLPNGCRAQYHATSELVVEVVAGDNTMDFPLVSEPGPAAEAEIQPLTGIEGPRHTGQIASASVS